MSERSIGSEKTFGGGGEFEIERPGAKIGDRYEVLALIGEGGMGAVYRCRDLKLEREVAVKRLSASGAAARAGLERFQREAKAVASLNHRNIVVVHEYGDDARGPYLVMELLAGRDLASAVANAGALAVDDVKEIARQVCGALTYAHKRGVIHRDIKPSNLFRLADGAIKVLDFGLARVGTETQLSIEGFGLGTLDYVSPEQRRDASRVDHRSDLFSLGATLYFLSTAKSPRTVKERDLPDELREVVLKLMEERPEERYFSMAEVQAALERSPAPGASRASAKSDDACSSCGQVNAPDVRFCEGCGTGLFEKCPSCSAEGRAGRKYCGKCGVSIPDFRRAQEHAARAQEHEAARQWSRAEKEWGEALRQRKDMAEAKAGVENTRAKQASAREERERCERAVSERDLTEARAALERLEKLVPVDDEVLAELRTQRLAPLEKRWTDLEAAQRAVERFLGTSEWDLCEAALERAEVLWPGHTATADLRGRFTAARAAQERTLSTAERALAARDLDAAEGALRETENHRGERAQRLRAALAEARRRQAEARSLRKSAESLVASGWWETADAKLDEAKAIWDAEREDAAARASLSGARERLDQAIANVHGAIAAHDVGGIAAAEAGLRTHAVGREGTAAVVRAREAIDEARAMKAAADVRADEAARLLQSDDFAGAVAACDAVERMWPGHDCARLTGEPARKKDAELAEALRVATVALGQRDLKRVRQGLDRARLLSAFDARIQPLLALLVAAERRRLRLRLALAASAIVVVVAAWFAYREKERRALVARARTAAERVLSGNASADDELVVIVTAAAVPDDEQLSQAATRILVPRVETKAANYDFAGADEALRELERLPIAASEHGRLRKLVDDRRAAFATDKRGQISIWAKEVTFDPDPSVVSAEWRSAIAATGLPWLVQDRATGIEMVLVPPGTYGRGSDDGYADEKPVHTVTISKPFYLGRTEVTAGQWQHVMGESDPSCNKLGLEHPVDCVSWDRVQEFLANANGRTRDGLRLPTEAEWEYACRAGTDGATYGNLDDIAWYAGNSESRKRAAKTRTANALGLHDMLGNVWEWCADWYGPYEPHRSGVSDPEGPSSGRGCVLRGGSWINDSTRCRASYRTYAAPDNRYDDGGFRVARTP